MGVRGSVVNCNARGERRAMSQTPQSQQAKSVINEEEARTELLATLSAARELGPEMDETLASRFVERLDALFPNPARDQTRLRRDVEALLVSARSHGPDADAARVKDFLASALAPQPTPPVFVQQPAPPATAPGNLAAYIPTLIGAAVIIAIVAASGGHAFWLLFWLLPMLFWSGRGRRRRMRYRRYGYWDGYGPGYGPTMPPGGSRRRLPPGDDPEIL
jgi:hypothetical protein